MRHKSEMYDVSSSLILGMLGCIFLAACSEGKSSQGYSTNKPPQAEEAQRLIEPYYPEAAKLNVAVDDDPRFTAYYLRQDETAYINSDTLDWSAHELGCLIVHEWVHHIQVDTRYGTKWRDIAETEAYVEQDKCLSKFT